MKKDLVSATIAIGATKAGSQAGFARAMGVNPATVHRWRERGFFPANQVEKISEYIGIDATTRDKLRGLIIEKKLKRYQSRIAQCKAEMQKGE
jgi:transposase-like protein